MKYLKLYNKILFNFVYYDNIIQYCQVCNPQTLNIANCTATEKYNVRPVNTFGTLSNYRVDDESTKLISLCKFVHYQMCLLIITKKLHGIESTINMFPSDTPWRRSIIIYNNKIHITPYL